MKTFILGGLLAAILLGAVQAEEELLPPPSNPAVRRAPNFAAWTVHYSYASKKNEQGASDPVAAPVQDRPAKALYQKTQGMYREVTEWLSGKTSEKWNLEGLQLQTGKNNNVVALLPRPEGKDFAQPDYLDFSASDFPELTWVTLNDYRGIAMHRGRPCYVFSRNSDGKNLTVKLSERQLPLEFDSGESVRVYEMGQAPAGMLTPPDAFRKALLDHQRGKEALRRHPSPP